MAAGQGRRTFVDGTGRTVSLTRELGRGGEGAVFEVAGATDLVAKVYHTAPDHEKAAKLVAMARGTTPDLLAVAAWPTATLHERPGGAVIGLTMARTVGAEVHRLYSPAHRKVEFPAYDWEKLIVVARNTAAAIARIHQAGHVVGDVNQGNVVITASGHVKLIDCDSFQVRDGALWRLCDVGVAHFTPPELQGQSFRGVVRTPNHDAFGLAVLLFHLLFMGRHPYAGRFAGRGDMPLERAISEHRFAFGREAPARQMKRPPHALPLDAASAAVAEGFERAFGAHAGNASARTSAARWVELLDGLRAELATCQTTRAHKYHRSLGGHCPWCAIERDGGPDFFISVAATVRATADGFSLSLVWEQIAQVPAPAVGAMPTPARAQVAPIAPVDPIQRWMWRGHRLLLLGSGIVALLTLIERILPVGWLFAFLGVFASQILRLRSGLVEEFKARDQAVTHARKALDALHKQWDQETAPVRAAFEAHKQTLADLHAEYLQMDGKRRAERQQLESQREAHQRRRFLDRYYIENATLRGIGPALKMTLASYGIETAADITAHAVAAVPGFGHQRVQTILAWQRQVAAGFRFDATKGVDASDIQALMHKYERRARELETELSAGPNELRRRAARVQETVSRLTGEIDRQQRVLAEAVANRQALG